MRIIDTTDNMLTSYASDHFDMAKWEAYMDASVPGAKEMCLADMRECVAAGFSWDGDFLPVLDSVLREEEKRTEAIRSFHTVADHLDGKIIRRFGRTVDADLILYLGLCNGAGWVTTVSGRTTVLLGIEKILELSWHGIDAMNGLVIHELDHVYQAQFGVLSREIEALPDQLLWQLFTEGIAMVFEQEVLGNPEYYTQDSNGWKQWCDRHFELIRRSFHEDLKTMTHDNQRYFGDWVRFEGYGDVGYYLGTRFVRFLLCDDRFDNLIAYDVRDVRDGYERFLSMSL